MHKRTCSRNLNGCVYVHEPPQCVRILLHCSRTLCDPRTTDSIFPRCDECVRVRACARMKINPNFSRDQLDRVDRGRTNRDTIAKGEQWGTWRMPEKRETNRRWERRNWEINIWDLSCSRPRSSTTVRNVQLDFCKVTTNAIISLTRFFENAVEDRIWTT